jgi:signal peptidase I
MKSTVRARCVFEAALASLSGFLGVLTLFRRDWIEATTGFSPDLHSGSLEWAIVAALFAICGIAGLAARAEWRRPAAVPGGSMQPT